MMDRTFVLAGGGTGGHVYPGIAVAEALLQQEPDARILFVGSGRDVEQQIVSDSGFESIALNSVPLRQLRRNPFRFVSSTLSDFRTAREVLDSHAVSAVIGLGGWASVPTVRASLNRRIPVVLLEQNVVPGRATRLFARRCPVCLPFDESRAYLKTRSQSPVTGNPVRRSIAELAANPCDKAGGGRRKSLLVLGGSQGSHQVNEAIIAAANELKPELREWFIMHQAGPSDAEVVRKAYERTGLNADVRPFFDDLPDRYRKATLAVSRAGATTLAELACAGIPAILLPYPQARDDHQNANARVFEKAGAAVRIPTESTMQVITEELARALREFSQPGDAHESRCQSMRDLSRPDAADRVVEFVLAFAFQAEDQ